MKNLEVFNENAVGTKYPYEVKVTTSQEDDNTGGNQGGNTGDNIGENQESVTGQVKVEMYNSTQNSSSNTLAPMFRLTNAGDTAINMCDLELRYYYTKDENIHQNFWCDWSNIGSQNVVANFIDINATEADNYLSLTFKDGEIAPGGTVYINTRIARDNWSNYIQEGDYSFKKGRNSYEEWQKVTLYSKGNLIWGIEP